MSVVSFYHLNSDGVVRTICQLLRKIYATNNKLRVIVRDSEMLKELDTKLWSLGRTTFVPHGVEGGENESLQPIIFSSEGATNINNAKYLMVVGVLEEDINMDFERVFFVFDSNIKKELNFARAKYSEFKKLGHQMVYYKQNDEGTWEKLE